jgi:hypothetical protein
MDKIIIKNKRILDFYNKYKNLNIEQVNIMIIELYESMLDNMSGEMNKNITSEILSTVKKQGNELDRMKNELNILLKDNLDIYKSEFFSIKTINNLTNTNIISEITSIKESLNKLNTEITNSIISKFYDIRTIYNEELKCLLDKNGNENLIKIIDKIEKENTILVDKTNLIVTNIIPKSQQQYYNQHELTIKEFKDDMIKNIDIIKSNIKDNKDDITLDKLNILISDKYNSLLTTIQHNVLNYINVSEERLKQNINEIKDDKILRDFKEDMIKQIDIIRTEVKDNNNDISLDKINLLLNDKYNNVVSTVQNNVLNYINNSEERIKININEIKDLSNTNQTFQEKINEELILFLNQYKISSKKGELSENMLESILIKLYPSSEIINTTGQISSGDFILKRNNQVKILIENKNYESNVPKREIDKFILDVETQNCSGIMISQHSGISFKKNFEIDINNGNILIYIHNMNYDSDKIVIACDIIDNLSNKIKELNGTDEHVKISSNILQLINEQYQRFIEKKELIISQLNNNTKQIIESLKDLELSELNNILSNKFASSKISNYKCEICNNYLGNSLLSLSRHKTSCRKKQLNNQTNENKSEQKDISLDTKDISSDTKETSSETKDVSSETKDNKRNKTKK